MSLLARLQDYLAQGGLVMLPLIGVTFALWYALGYRVLRLRRGKRQTVAARIASVLEGARRGVAALRKALIARCSDESARCAARRSS